MFRPIVFVQLLAFGMFTVALGAGTMYWAIEMANQEGVALRWVIEERCAPAI